MNGLEYSVSILSEIPESLHKRLKEYVEKHPECDQDAVVTDALALFLFSTDLRLETAKEAA